MQSKEEIEKALNNLWNSLDDELFNLTYSQEEMQKDLRTVPNEYNYLNTMNDRKEQKIQHLESREQKLIEKLEEDSDYFIKGAGSYVRDEATVEQERLIAKFEYAQKILAILKGENNE